MTLPRAAVNEPHELRVTSRRLGTHTAQVQTQTDTDTPLSVGPDKPVAIQSTAYGTVSIGITAGALTVLVLAFVVRGVRWARRRGRPTPVPAPA